MSDELCERCQANPATFHHTVIEGGTKSETHLCEACAAAEGESLEGGLVANLTKTLTQGSQSATEACPHCGITFEEFRAKGRFGCPRDYEVFADALLPLLGKMHNGGRRHTGRLPRGRTHIENATGDRLLQLRQDLQKAVHQENYEEAARIRDEIQGIEGPSGVA